MTEAPRGAETGPAVDAAGEPIEDPELLEDSHLHEQPTHRGPPSSGRLLDRGAIFAGWVGLGMAVVIAISFELVIAIQALVFITAPIAGILIGWYANQRSQRWRPRGRVFADAGYAGLVTGLSLAFIYVALRLLFVYADSGYRPEPQGGQLDCDTGPACTYLRFIEEGFTEELEADGISDAASFESAVWRRQGETFLILTAMTLAGALGAATVRAVRSPATKAAPPTAGAGAAGLP